MQFFGLIGLLFVAALIILLVSFGFSAGPGTTTDYTGTATTSDAVQPIYSNALNAAHDAAAAMEE